MGKKGLEMSGMVMYMIILIIVAILVTVLIYGYFEYIEKTGERIKPETLINAEDLGEFFEYKEVEICFPKKAI